MNRASRSELCARLCLRMPALIRTHDPEFDQVGEYMNMRNRSAWVRLRANAQSVQHQTQCHRALCGQQCQQPASLRTGAMSSVCAGYTAHAAIKTDCTALIDWVCSVGVCSVVGAAVGIADGFQIRQGGVRCRYFKQISGTGHKAHLSVFLME